MKRTILVGVLCGLLGVAVGSAWAGPPPNAQDQVPLFSALASIEKGVQDLGGAKKDAGGHVKKATELANKACDEIREALGVGHGSGGKHAH